MKNSWKILIIAMISFITSTSEFVIVGVLDKIALSTQISISEAGQLITVFAIASAIGTPIFIYFMRAMNLRKILLISLSFFVMGCLLMLIAPNYPLLLLSRIIMAFGVGVYNVLSFIVASKLAAPDKRAGAIATVTTGLNAALIIGLPIGRIITAAFGWKAIFVSASVLCSLAIFMVAKFVPAFKGDKSVPFKAQFELLKSPKILLSLAMSFFWIVGYALLYSYITPYLKTTSSMNEQMLSLSFLVFGIATLVGNKSGGFLGDRIGFTKTVLGSMAFNVIALVLLSVLTGSFYITLTILVMWAVASWLPGPLLRYSIIELAPETPGVILSLYNSIIQFGFAIGAGLGGMEVARMPIIMLSWSAAGMTTIALLFAFIYSYRPMVLQPIRIRNDR